MIRQVWRCYLYLKECVICGDIAFQKKIVLELWIHYLCGLNFLFLIPICKYNTFNDPYQPVFKTEIVHKSILKKKFLFFQKKTKKVNVPRENFSNRLMKNTVFSKFASFEIINSRYCVQNGNSFPVMYYLFLNWATECKIVCMYTPRNSV